MMKVQTSCIAKIIYKMGQCCNLECTKERCPPNSSGIECSHSCSKSLNVHTCRSFDDQKQI